MRGRKSGKVEANITTWLRSRRQEDIARAISDGVREHEDEMNHLYRQVCFYSNERYILATQNWLRLTELVRSRAP